LRIADCGLGGLGATAIMADGFLPQGSLAGRFSEGRGELGSFGVGSRGALRDAVRLKSCSDR
jgi:hypothetical protein